ncbi:hypothetical protein JCM5296_002118 [Sporobolomyces johnsonii]
MASSAAPAVTPSAGELTPTQLAALWKKQGGFDALRKQLLQDFLSSPDKDALLTQLDTLLPALLSSSPSLARQPKKDRPAFVLAEAEKRGALKEAVKGVEGGLRKTREDGKARGIGRRVERELRRCLRSARGMDGDGEEEEESEEEETPAVQAQAEPSVSTPLPPPPSVSAVSLPLPSDPTTLASAPIPAPLPAATPSADTIPPLSAPYPVTSSHNAAEASEEIVPKQEEDVEMRGPEEQEQDVKPETLEEPAAYQPVPLSLSQARQMEQSAPRGLLVVVRSSDGAAFPLTAHDFHNISTLDELRFNLLAPLLEIPPECLILMNEEGSPLNRDEAVQHLAMLAGTPANSGLLSRSAAGGGGAGDGPGQGQGQGARERRVYVFDRDHLDADPDEVARLLAVTDEMVLGEPPLNPEDPLPSHLSLSHHNLTTLRALISSIELQRASLALALSNLHRVNTGTSSSFALFLEAARPNLERYERLLAGWEEAMGAVGRVAVVAGLLMRGGGTSASASASASAGAGHAREGSAVSAGGPEKQRFLGDYVSSEKMLAVRDGCAKVLAELKLRTDGLQATLNDVVTNTEAVQADLEAMSHDLEDLDACEQDAEHGHMRIEELVRAGEQMTDPELLAQCFEELSVCDAEHRDRIRFLVERKNAMTRYLLLEMQKISTLQSDIASMPADLSALDHDLRTRTENFKHLARLEGLIPAYVATVAEVVRRREYARLLTSHSASLSTSLTPLSTTERARRSAYRANFSGKLPWEVRGLGASADEAIPEMALDVDLKGQEGLPELSRETLNNLQRSFRELADSLPPDTSDDNPIKKAHNLLDELIRNVDDLSKEFDRISLDPPPPTTPPAPTIDPARLEELEAQIRHLEETNDSLSRQLQTERSAREEEVAKLEARCSAAESSNAQLEQDVKDAIGHREAVERELGTTRAAELELKKQWEALDQSHTRLQGELGTVKLELERARAAAAEHDSALRAAEETQRKLTLGAAEKDRLLRDQRTEAELDRAVLEKELDEVRRVVEGKERDLELARRRERTLEEFAEGMREQVARWERVAQTKDEDVGAARREVEEAKLARERGIVDVQRELVKAQRQAREAVVLAGRLRSENDTLTQVLNTPPPPKGDASTAELDRAAQPPPVPAPPPVPPFDYAQGDIDELLQELGKYSHDALTDAVKNKVESLTTVTKKWVKEAKAYRERAHRAMSGANDKIAFRNFAKGDLALFLPTRNSTVPVWAAFNVSFPHHFLSATGIIAEQMKTREWIVARITSLTEKVVDPKDPSSNPYLLAAGTKFFLLEVEPWSSKESSRSRKHSSTDKSKSSRPSTSGHSRAPRGSDPTTPVRAYSTTSADSAILVDRPTMSASTPNIRRSVSEGLPPNATPMARSEYAIVEVDEPENEIDSRPPSPSTLRQPVPRSTEPFDAPPSATSSPSALSRALARSQPSTPSEERQVDSFVPPLQSASSNPFASSSSPVVGSPLRPRSTPPATDYDPSHTSAGALPAFLPASGKKPPSAAPASGGSSHSPRYIRASPSSRHPGGSTSISLGHANPAADLISASPASTSASSVHVISHPRSASSGSSILSSSIHRRAVSGRQSVSPSLPEGKAPATNEAQLTGSRWNLLQEDLGDAATTPTARTLSNGTKMSGSMTVGRKSKSTKGWPTLPTSSTTGSLSTSPARTAGTPPGKGLLSSSASSSSVFDMLTGRSRSTGAAGGAGSSASSSKGKVAAVAGSSAEEEMRKLLGQPPF